MVIRSTHNERDKTSLVCKIMLYIMYTYTERARYEFIFVVVARSFAVVLPGHEVSGYKVP